MEVKMVLRQIREHRHVEVTACHAVEYERMRRYLHDDIVDIRFDHTNQYLLQVDNIGRRIVDRDDLIFDHDLYRTDNTDTVACFLKDRTQHVCRSRFAVRTRHTDHSEFTRRIIKEARYDRLHRRARIRYTNDRNAFRHLDIFLCNDRDSTCFHSLLRKRMTIDTSTVQTDKERTCRYCSGII